MNAESILRVADAIEKHEIADLGFNMNDWVSSKYPDKSGHNCGTSACIAGYAVAAFDGMDEVERINSLTEDEKIEQFFGRAREIFDMDTEDADDLMVFFSGDPTPLKAARTLRHLAATGEVNWNLPETAP
jgi:hypothetical protein